MFKILVLFFSHAVFHGNRFLIERGCLRVSLSVG